MTRVAGIDLAGHHAKKLELGVGFAKMGNGRDHLLDALDAVGLKFDRRENVVGREYSGGHRNAKRRSGVDQADVEALPF